MTIIMWKTAFFDNPIGHGVYVIGYIQDSPTTTPIFNYSSLPSIMPVTMFNIQAQFRNGKLILEIKHSHYMKTKFNKIL